MKASLRLAFDDHRDERAAELYEIADILADAALTPDAGPIRQAAGQCRQAVRISAAEQPDAGREYWGYEIAGLRVNLEDQRHARPRRAFMKDATGVLSITVQEYVPSNEAEVGESYGLLRRLDTGFALDVHLDVEGARHPLRACWHVDTHLHTATRSHGVHPRFHYQAGGEGLDDLDELIRGVFVPEVPRVPCAPLDAVLAIDFVLGQYCGELWHMMYFLKPEYHRVRKKPIERYWYPYFRELADGAANPNALRGDHPAALLLPHLCCG